MKIGEIMTLKPVSVSPEDPVVLAAKILTKHNFNGLPVIDKNQKLLGIVTEYDLISKGSALHLPTLINILGNVDIYKKDSGPVKDEIKNLLSLKVKDVMNIEPLTINQDSSVEELTDLFAHHHRVNPIPVIDGNSALVGIVSRFDLVKLFANEKAHQNISPGQPRVSDKEADGFIDDFEKKFMFVSRTRVRLWPIISLSFAIVGFIIAFAIIIRIATK